MGGNVQNYNAENDIEEEIAEDRGEDAKRPAMVPSGRLHHIPVLKVFCLAVGGF